MKGKGAIAGLFWVAALYDGLLGARHSKFISNPK
jgi:hypothetical protein